ncbi:MAG: DUF58 domain-containing protein [Pseudomonadales bacterium]
MSESTISGNKLFRSLRFQKWLNRRMPPANSIELHQGNIFILPTREGLYFTILITVMVIAGINYQNSLIFMLAFTLLSVFMLGILHTFRNLSGVMIQASSSKPVFAGEDAEFNIIVARGGARTYEGLVVGWHPDLLQGVDLITDEEVRVKLYVPTKQRGRMNPGRMLIETNYPLGLFRAWSWVDLDMSTIVYPVPLYAGAIPESVSSTHEGEMLSREGVDDFHGLRDFQPGDPVRHIAWKSYARTEELQVKEYSAFVDRRVWLDWNHFSSMDRENRLSRLCYWVLMVSKSSDAFGLRLPGVEIEPDQGHGHREKCLKELALFETAT